MKSPYPQQPTYGYLPEKQQSLPIVKVFHEKFYLLGKGGGGGGVATFWGAQFQSQNMFSKRSSNSGIGWGNFQVLKSSQKNVKCHEKLHFSGRECFEVLKFTPPPNKTET